MRPEATTQVIDDLPVQRDLLGYGPYASAIAGILDDEALETPYCVGIYGAWGTGKTTFMSMVEQRLRLGPDNIVWFQPWLFDNKEEVWKALIYTALQHLDIVRARREIIVEGQAERMRRLFLGLGKLTLNTALAAMPVAGLSVDEVSEMVSRAERDVTQFVNTFRLEFEKLKNELLESDGQAGARLLFFIDDLDRCTPESCITALEAIKLFFDMRGCVFVLGIDRELVQRGVEMKYGADAGIDGESYLEKLVQLPFHLPPVSPDSFSRFLAEVTKDLNFSEATRDLLVLASDQNPRRVKRLASCLNLVRSVAHSLSAGSLEDLDDEKLATLLILQVRFPLEYLWLSRTPVTLKDVADDSDDSDLPLVRFLEPVLGEKMARHQTAQFVDFLRRGELADFHDRLELDRYMKLSGVVDVSAPLIKKPLIELLDRRLADFPSADEAGVPDAVDTDQATENAGALADARIGELEQEATYVLDAWHDLRQVSLSSVLIPGSLGTSESDIVSRLEALDASAASVLDAFGRLPPAEQPVSLRRQMDSITTIQAERVIRGLRVTAIWSVMVVLLVTAIGWYALWLFLVPGELALWTLALGVAALIVLARLGLVLVRIRAVVSPPVIASSQ